MLHRKFDVAVVVLVLSSVAGCKRGNPVAATPAPARVTTSAPQSLPGGTLEGIFLGAADGSLLLRDADDEDKVVAFDDTARLIINRREVTHDQLQPGSLVRVTYELHTGSARATAVRVLERPEGNTTEEATPVGIGGSGPSESNPP